MPQILITVCNTRPAGLSLARFDFESSQFEWIENGLPANAVNGATGICPYQGGFCVLLQQKLETTTWRTHLAWLDQTLHLRKVTPLSLIRDGHSMIEHAGCLMIASTGTNQLVRVYWDGARAIEESLWDPGESGIDSHHVNSIQEFGGDIYVSMFGAKVDLSWSTTTQGQVINITSGKVALTGMHHPHSLFVCNGELCILDSRRGSVLRVDRGFDTGIPLWTLSGYLRGAVQDGPFLYVGSSAGRTVSRSRGNRIAPGARPESHIYRIDTRSGIVESRNLTPFLQEIYDLAIIPECSRQPFLSDREAALARRLQLFDGQQLEILRGYDEHLRHLLLYDHELHRLINEDHNFETAALLLERLLEKDPVNADWQCHYAVCLLHLGRDPQAAARHLDAALENGFSEFWVRFHLTTAYLQQGDLAQAQSNLARAAELRPEGVDLEPLAKTVEAACDRATPHP